MKCFNHHERDAVGACKNCCKGLCSECAVEIENGLSCKGACEERITLINGMIDSSLLKFRKSDKILSITGKAYCTNGYVYLALGILFVLSSFFLHRGVLSFPGVLGIVFILASIPSFNHGRFIMKQALPDNKEEIQK